MKAFKKVMAIALSIAMVATSITVTTVNADDYQKVEMEHMQINRARIKDAGENNDSNGKHVEVYWEGALPENNDVVDSSYGRMVVSAPAAGEYTFKLGCTCWWDINVKVFVNDEVNDVTLFTGTNQEAELTLTLEKGKNAIIIAWGDWAEMDYVLVPSALTVEPQSTALEYPAGAAYLNMTWFHADTSIYDPEATLYTGTMYLNVDGTTGEVGAEEWQPSATYDVTAPADFLELKLEYYIEAAGTGTPSMSLIINDNEPLIVEIDDSSVVRVSKEDLVAAGLVLGETNTIKVKQTVNTGCSFGLYGMKFLLEAEAESETGIAANSLVEDGKIKMLGRSLVENNSMTMDWTCSGFSFVYDGSGDVVANITTSNASPLVVVVDGKESTVTARAGSADIKLATGLEDGTHTIAVYKTTEANGYLAKLNSIKYTDKEATLTATKEAELKFEFVGDSITCGNQIESESGAENGYYAYASILARAYGADWNTISCSGRGLMQGYNSELGWAGSNQAQLKDLFDYVSYFRNSTATYDYTYQPDVLVVNVGSNDLGDNILATMGTTINNFTAEVTAFHNKVRAKYPNTKIIWCYGTYYNRGYEAEYRAAVNALNDSNSAFVYFPQMLGGNSGHPNYIQHERMAKILSATVAEMLNVENPLGADLHFEAESGVVVANGTNGTLKTESGDCAYSSNAYAADMNSITTDYNNAAHVAIPVTVDKAGVYKATVSYGAASDAKPTIAIKSNNYAWEALSVDTGLYWDTMKTFDVELYLKAGSNTVSITGATNENAWANIDCVDLQYVGEGTEPPTVTGPSENPTTGTNGGNTDNSGATTVDPTTQAPTVAKPITDETPAKAKISSAKNNKKKAVKLTWKAVKNATSYEVQYSLNKKFKKAKKFKTTVKTTTKLKITIKKLKKGKKYFFRVRGVNGDVYGKWSKAKKVKITK